MSYYPDWDGTIDDDLDEYDLRQQDAHERRMQRNCLRGPDCGCPLCEPEITDEI